MIFARTIHSFFSPTNAGWVGEGKERDVRRDLRFYSHAHSYIFIYAICKVSLQDRIFLYIGTHRLSSICDALVWYLFDFRLFTVHFQLCQVHIIFVTYIRMYVLYVGHGVRNAHGSHYYFHLHRIRWLKKSVSKYSLVEVYIYILRCERYAADFLREQFTNSRSFVSKIVLYNSGNFNYSIFINEYILYVLPSFTNHFSSGTNIISVCPLKYFGRI